MLEQCWNKPIRQVRNEIGKMSCLPIGLVLCNFWIVSIAVSLRQKQAQQTPSTGAGWNGGTADIYNSPQVVVVIETWKGSAPYYPFLQYHNLKYNKAPPNSECYFIDFHSNFNFTATLDRVGLGMSTGPRLQKQSLELARRHWEGLAHEKTDTKGDGRWSEMEIMFFQDFKKLVTTLVLEIPYCRKRPCWEQKVFENWRFSSTPEDLHGTWRWFSSLIVQSLVVIDSSFTFWKVQQSDCIEPRFNPNLYTPPRYTTWTSIQYPHHWSLLPLSSILVHPRRRKDLNEVLQTETVFTNVSKASPRRDNGRRSVGCQWLQRYVVTQELYQDYIRISRKDNDKSNETLYIYDYTA